MILWVRLSALGMHDCLVSMPVPEAMFQIQPPGQCDKQTETAETREQIWQDLGHPMQGWTPGCMIGRRIDPAGNTNGLGAFCSSHEHWTDPPSPRVNVTGGRC